MIRGNISNLSAPILAFNIDSLLFIEEEETPKEGLFKIIEIFKAPKKKRQLNYKFINAINSTWRNHNYSIYFVTTKGDMFSELTWLLAEENISYTRLDVIEDLNELVTKCRNQYEYYFDGDVDILRYISCNNALSINTFYDAFLTR